MNSTKSSELTLRTITLEGFRSMLALLISCLVCDWAGGGVLDAASFSCTKNHQHCCQFQQYQNIITITNHWSEQYYQQFYCNNGIWTCI